MEKDTITMNKQQIEKIYNYLYKIYISSKACSENDRGWKEYNDKNNKKCFGFQYYNYNEQDYVHFYITHVDFKGYNIFSKVGSHRKIDFEIRIKKDYSGIDITSFKQMEGYNVVEFIKRLHDELVLKYDNKEESKKQLLEALLELAESGENE